jgi:hypothetical protein
MMQRKEASQSFVEALEQFVLEKYNPTGEKAFVPPHGPGGLMTFPGVRPDMYSLVPRVGTFASSLPIRPSKDAVPLWEFLTGVTAQTGTNPDTTCGTPPVAGKLKIAQITAPFGTFYKATDQMNISDAGLRINRSDENRRLRTPVGNIAENPFVPVPPNASAESFNTWLGKAYMEFGQGAMLDFARVDWRGDPTKLPAATVLGFIKEYRGLDGWIKTGYVDLESGNTVASLDSQVVNYNATLSSTFVVAAVNMYDNLLMQAELTNVPNTMWDIVVHPRMKSDLFDIWACNYHTARCLPASNAAVRLDSQEVTRLRDAMRNGNYLLINGEQVRVLWDAGIDATQSEATGIWTSDFYFVPREDGMGNDLTYREYLPYDGTNQDMNEIVAQSGGEYRTLNGGFYLMTFIRTVFCIQWVFTNKSRIIMERPDLAGRLDNVQFTNTSTANDPFPGSTYHKNGGTTFREDYVTA